MRLKRIVAPVTLVASITLASGEAPADTKVPAFSLIAHYGRYPASISADDPAYRSVGLIYPSDPSGLHVPQYSHYVVGVLVSDCHVVTSSDGLAGIAAGVTPASRLHFALAPFREASGFAPNWELSVVLPQSRDERGQRWTLLRIRGCERSETDLTEGIMDGAATALARDDAGAQRFRQVGALITDGDDFVPIMIGGAYQQYDAGRRQWTITGIAVDALPERSGHPAMAADALAPNRVGGWDDGISAFPRPSDHVEPLSDIASFLAAKARQQALQEPGI